MDYRESKFESYDNKNIKNDKTKLAKLIDSRVSNSANKGQHYPKLSKKSSAYYKMFQEIYHLKCAYCGVNTAIQPTSMFEIDHYVNKMQEKLSDGVSVHHIKNIVFACRKCNQAKKDFDVNTGSNTCCECLHPDNEVLPVVFERKENYSIEIKPEYSDCKLVNEFYEKMDFSNRLRKLDYLLLNLYTMRELPEFKMRKNLINSLFIELITTRNQQV